MKCSICNKPVILVPSAKERARTGGGKASDYTALFTAHADCVLEKRKKETDALIKRINK